MADTAFQTQYQQQFIRGFEQSQSLLRNFVTTEGQSKGNQFVFHVADSGGASAVTRGVNGKIPGRPDNHQQLTCTLQEWHDVPEKTGFNIFASQGDGKMIMQATSMGVMNRKIDELIITEADTGTVGAGDTPVTGSLQWFMRAKTRLQNAKVPWDGNITALITPAAEGYMLQLKEFASAEYVGKKPMDGSLPSWMDKPMYYRWLGMNIVVHPELPGAGASDETCFMFHRSAIGHAADVKNIQTFVGYDEREDTSYCRVTCYMGSKKLQNAGIIVMPHDGSGLSS